MLAFWPENFISSTPVGHSSVRNVVVSGCFVHEGERRRWELSPALCSCLCRDAAPPSSPAGRKRAWNCPGFSEAACSSGKQRRQIHHHAQKTIFHCGETLSVSDGNAYMKGWFVKKSHTNVFLTSHLCLRATQSFCLPAEKVLKRK